MFTRLFDWAYWHAPLLVALAWLAGVIGAGFYFFPDAAAVLGVACLGLLGGGLTLVALTAVFVYITDWLA